MKKRRTTKEIHIVLITGDRNYLKAYVRMLKREILKLVNKHGVTKLVIMHGGAPGVDTLADKISKSMNVHTISVDALWETRHASAGPQRNKIMACIGPDEVLGFHLDIENSVGTAGMLKLAEKRGVKHRLIES